jgi:rare lipoprotein A
MISTCYTSFLKQNLAKAWIVLLLVFTAASVTAQVADSEAKTKSSKTKRVFYGQASFYSNKFQGRKTANGEIFDQKKLTCACNVLPLGTWIKVTNLRNSRTVTVKTNDRLHPRMRRIVDLTRAAASKLGFISGGLTRVKIEVIGKKPPQ